MLAPSHSTVYLLWSCERRTIRTTNANPARVISVIVTCARVLMSPSVTGTDAARISIM